MTIAGKFFKWVSLTFFNLKAETQKLVPASIDACEAVKKWMDNPNTDKVLTGIEDLIPGKTDDIIINFAHNAIHTWLPIILLKLQSIESLIAISPADLDAKLRVALDELKFSSPENREMFWVGFSGTILKKLASENVDLTTAIKSIQDYYKTYDASKL